MPRVLVLNGPNLGRLGSREPDVYGAQDLSALRVLLVEQAGSAVEIDLRQTDDEAELIHWLYEAVDTTTPVILNPAAFTHYSYAIRDAISAVRLPTIEVHLSNIHGRDEFRRHSVIAPVVSGQIAGLGARGYLLALEAAKDIVEQSHR